MAPELVVLLDEDLAEIGALPKSEVHARTTPLHLGFSCYLLDVSGRLLVTRRALTKKTWPGVWTNSFCGHPAPGEGLEAAVRRRARHELAAELASVDCVLPDFRYRAVDPGGVEENELCPVFIARLTGTFTPNESETAEWAWVDPRWLADVAARTPFLLSPWAVEQLPHLLDSGAFHGARA